MNAIISPQYKQLTNFIKSLPEENYQVEETFCNKRNTVTKISIENKSYVVKKYKCPNIFNRIAYTWFRKSKARRSYEYAHLLLQKGVNTANPVAYIEIKKKGLFHTGYFISEYLEYPLLDNVSHLDKIEGLKLGNDFIEFTAKLHEKGILHKDYNKGNIFYFKENGKYNFALIDINRLRFKKNSNRDCIKAFNQLGLQLDQAITVLAKYSKARNWNIKESLLTYLVVEKTTDAQNTVKKKFKSIRNKLSWA